MISINFPKYIALKTILFYRKYISPLLPNSCRYYPTCSQYALWRFENENFWKALFFASLRVLKCNQFFKGGIDYPVISKRKTKIQFKKIDVKYWFVPKEKNRFYKI